MEKDRKIEKKVNIIYMSEATKKRISKVSHEINGKNLFTDKIELAEKTLQDVNSLPI
jgi:hypothetical protein